MLDSISGILAAIAIPAYQDDIAKAKVSAALSDIRGGQTAYELQVSGGATAITTGTIGLKATTGNCTAISVNPPTGNGSVNAAMGCVISNPGRIGTAPSIQIARSVAGTYTCTITNVGALFQPVGCNTTGVNDGNAYTGP